MDENNQEISFKDFKMDKSISGDEVYSNIEFH